MALLQALGEVDPASEMLTMLRLWGHRWNSSQEWWEAFLGAAHSLLHGCTMPGWARL